MVYTSVENVKSMLISIVIPVYNEENSLRIIHKKIHKVNRKLTDYSFEIIFVDDGSEDSSWSIIKELACNSQIYILGIKLRKNLGKSTALSAGFENVNGDIVITMDADLQDEPEEIPRLLSKLEEGYDLVSGWKKERHDSWHKVFASRIFNLVTRILTQIKIHDFNCGFKIYRREVISNIQLYGELHRYIPVLANNLGYRISELPVKHHARKYGKSKYGLERLVSGLLDLLTVLTLTNYNQKPSHLFSGLGMGFGFIGSISLIYLIIQWFLGNRPIGDRPLLLFGILAVLLSVQLISLGLLSEIILRNTRRESASDYIQDKINSAM